ncbi:MAG: D-2-hydroxyacid dehydrogenase [Oscillospiraceae bacterium]|nr:D-2-hydroxyacid dehydrogenase [Oscillospiraceae bacterium]MDD4367531.1 D-2-hydroxyacid dehydrogenase [Oscillospiraceae bacterium]
MQKLLFLGELSPALKQKLTAALPEWQVSFQQDPSAKAPAQLLAEVTALAGQVSGPFIKAALPEARQLGWIQSWSAGINHLPLPLLAQHGILVSTQSGIHAASISETIVGTMIAMVRQFQTCQRKQAAGVWQQDDRTRLSTIHGKRVGILGAGHIGQETARLLKAFNLETWGLRSHQTATEWIDHVVTPATVDALLRACDFVVNILPATPETRGFMNRERFSLMRPKSRYISVGRGQTTDTAALTEALQSGKLAAAALDVTDPEPLPAGHPLWYLPQVFLMPHQAGLFDQYDNQALTVLIDNARAFAQTGQPAVNLADLKRGY